MFGGPLIELVLVLFFVFLTMSAIVSTLQELIAQTFHVRTHTLRRCIRQMLHDDVYGDKIYLRFFRHPRIAVPGRGVSQLTNIDPEDFAVAMATAVQPEDAGDDCITELPASILALKDGELKQRLRLAMPDVFRKDATADQIKASVVAWFNASMNKTMEIYKASTRMRLYVTAAFVTVLFNVSPIKIAQELQSQPALRSAFASAVPELSTLVLNVSDNASAKLVDAGPSTAAPQKLAEGLSSTDVKSMLAIFECTRGRIGLPIGWPWMSEVFNDVGKRFSAAGKPPACEDALARAQLSPELNQRLQMLNLATPEMAGAAPKTAVEVKPVQPVAAAPAAALTPSAAAPAKPPATAAQPAPAPQPAIQQVVTTPETLSINIEPTADQKAVAAAMLKPTFGPNLDTDPWYMIILGWTVMILAAGQGAPFWFSLLQRIVSKR